MQKALDRLLANTNALRLLRDILSKPDTSLFGTRDPSCICRNKHSRSLQLDDDDDGNTNRRKLSREEEKQEEQSLPENLFRKISVDSPETIGLRYSPSSGRSPLTTGSAKAKLKQVHLQRKAKDVESHDTAINVQTTSSSRACSPRPYLSDASRWLQRLMVWERREGVTGIREVLTEMRAQGFDFSEAGDKAKNIWNLLCKHRELWGVSLEYAADVRSRTGKVWDALYIAIMRQCCQDGDPATLRWHAYFKDRYHVPCEPLKAIIGAVFQSQRLSTTFKQLYLAVNERNLYDTIIPRLCHRKKYRAAVDWHLFLTEHGDRPTAALSDHPFVRQMEFPGSRRFSFASDAVEELPALGPLRSRRYGKEASPIQRVPTFSFTQEVMSRVMGDVHNIRPVEITDQFCARLFATHAFPIDFVIMGLGAFGAQSVGPLSLRQLALRLDSSSALLEKVHKVREAGISIRECVFAQAIVKLATEKKEKIYNALLATDQHPEVLDDKETQLRLLRSYFERSDWHNVHWTLYILRHFHHWTENYEWNALVQHHAKESGWDQLSVVIEDVRQSGVRLTQETISCIFGYKMRPRRAGHRPIATREAYDSLFLANFLRCLFEDGWPVRPWQWNEVTRRLAMDQQWEEFSRIILWLTRTYDPSWANTGENVYSFTHPSRQDRQRLWMASTGSLPATADEHFLRQLFPPSRQGAIIEWGFHCGFQKLESSLKWKLEIKRHADQKSSDDRKGASTGDTSAIEQEDVLFPPPDLYPLRGLALLVELHSLGVHIDQVRVERVLRMRLWQLYAPFNISNVPKNRRAYQINPWPLEKLLFGVQRVLGLSDTNPHVFRRSGIPGHGHGMAAARQASRSSHDILVPDLSKATTKLDESVLDHNVGNLGFSTKDTVNKDSIWISSQRLDDDDEAVGSKQEPFPLPEDLPDEHAFPQMLSPKICALLRTIRDEPPLGPSAEQHSIFLRSASDAREEHVDAQQKPVGMPRDLLIHRVRLAMAVFGQQRPVHGYQDRNSRRVRMNLRRWIALVASQGTREARQKRALEGLLSPRIKGRFRRGTSGRARARFLKAQKTWQVQNMKVHKTL